jgi:S-(hydroxymethyl)glutathione dehydrogenase/alcohol dehydrogenase
MKTRAAVAWKAGAPLTIETVDLEGPRAGEVLVESRPPASATPTTTPSRGADPEGLFPAILGHEGAGVVVDVGPGVKSLKKGDHVIPLYTPECRAVQVLPEPQDQPVPEDPPTQGKGLMPDGSSRFSLNGQPILHYMGTSTFSNYIVVPEIALAKIREDAPFETRSATSAAA